MAISPGSYEFSGGAFMGGGSTPVEHDDIHSLILTKNGTGIGNYNPLVGDTTIDIPDDAVVVILDNGNGVMAGTQYARVANAVSNGIAVVAVSGSGGSMLYWKFSSITPSALSFQSLNANGRLRIAEVSLTADSDGNHPINYENVRTVIASAVQSLTDSEKEQARSNIGAQVPVDSYTSGMVVNSVTMTEGEIGYTWHSIRNPGTVQSVYLKADCAAIISFVINASASDSTGTHTYFEIGVRFSDGTHVFKTSYYRVPSPQSGIIPVPINVVLVGTPEYNGYYYCEVCSASSLSAGVVIQIVGSNTGSVQVIQFE